MNYTRIPRDYEDRETRDRSYQTKGMFIFAHGMGVEQNFVYTKFFETQRFQYFRHGETLVSPTSFPFKSSPTAQDKNKIPARGIFILVRRAGFEPAKPNGRQIYSLLRLTTPPPAQY